MKLSDYRGKAVLLNFWATWCPPCKIEMPWFVDMQKQYGKDGLVVLGVAMDDSESAKIAQFANEMGVNYPVLLGTDQVSDDYGNVQFLPTTFYIDRNGVIVQKVAGLLGRKDIEDDVRKALSSNSQPRIASSSQAARRSSPDQETIPEAQSDEAGPVPALGCCSLPLFWHRGISNPRSSWRRWATSKCVPAAAPISNSTSGLAPIFISIPTNPKPTT